MIPTGTLFNVFMVVLGSSIGLLFKKLISPEFNKKVFFFMGLFTVVLGMSMVIKSEDFILVFLSIVVGVIIGEYYSLDNSIKLLIDKLKFSINVSDDSFTDGLITAFLLFCIGSMTIVGAIDEGLGKEPNILYTKAVMDGVSSIILASTFGLGVLFSIFPMMIFQGGITMIVFYYKDIASPELINNISAVGGVLIIAMGFKLLGYKKINPTNLLPSLIVVCLLFLIKQYIIY